MQVRIEAVGVCGADRHAFTESAVGSTLDLLQAHVEWFAPLLTHTRGIERIDEAFAIASQYRDGVGKMVVRP